MDGHCGESTADRIWRERRGTYENPIELDGPIPADYPAEFADRPYVYMRPKGGDVTKVYRSYSDYAIEEGLMPKRIQLKRTKGWKMPPNTVNVARPGKWGNPFVIGEPCGVFKKGEGMRGMAETLVPALTHEQVIEFYDAVIGGMIGPEQYPTGHAWRDRFIKRHHGEWPQYTARRELRGKNLACWCKPGEPCHADVLLRVANS